MPPATSRRRKNSGKLKNNPSFDAIEEDIPSQQQTDDVKGDGEEEDQPRKRNRLRKEKASKGRLGGDDDHGEESRLDRANNDDDDAPIDVENFPNHPIDKKEREKLSGVAQDWGTLKKSIHENSFGLLKDIAASITELTEGEESEKALNELDIMIRDIIDIEEEIVANQTTVQSFLQQVLQDIPIIDSVDRYEKEVKDKMREHQQKTSRQKYAKNEEYHAFKQRIWEVRYPDKGMPPVSEFIPKEDGDNSDDEDDLEVGGITQDFKCPISLTPLENPYTSKICGHSFSKEAIFSYLEKSQAAKNCPASGCNQRFSLKDLAPNKDLAKRVKAAERRQQRQALESDDEDVIE